MSLEIKSVDVENEEEEKVITVFQSFGWKLKSSQRVFNQSSTPRGAISYENLTYIHSETQTIDFTKLVFERDTKMPNYDEIVELEEEFWALCANFSEPPYMPPDVHTMEDWATHFYPDLRTSKDKNKIHFIHGIILLTYFIIFVFIVNSSIINSSSLLILFTFFAIIGWSWHHSLNRCREKVFKIALKSEDSVYLSMLKERYDNVIKKIQKHEHCVSRVAEIHKRTAELIEK